MSPSAPLLQFSVREEPQDDQEDKQDNCACVGATVLGAAGIVGTVAAQSQPPIYGSQMMTDQERNAHRDRMRNAETVEERDRIRSEHHEQMRSRAAERGITLPDTPPDMRGGPGYGRGMGPGGRPGDGMGPGGRMGGGSGRGR